jgi:hypothetical protein
LLYEACEITPVIRMRFTRIDVNSRMACALRSSDLVFFVGDSGEQSLAATEYYYYGRPHYQGTKTHSAQERHKFVLQHQNTDE